MYLVCIRESLGMEVVAFAVLTIVPLVVFGRLYRTALRESSVIHRPKFEPTVETVEDHGVPITLSDDSMGLQ